MAEVTIPFFGEPTPRGLYGYTATITNLKDQRFVNCVPVASKNPITGSGKVYLQKRFGTTTATAADNGQDITANFYSNFQSVPYEGAGARVYRNSVSIGDITASRTVRFIRSALVNNIEYVCFVSYDSSGLNSEGWYHPSDATVTTFTGNRTSGSPVISGIASTAGLYSGQLATGTGLAAGTRILTVDSSSQVTLNANASSGAATSTVFTNEQIAKILDPDFPTNAQGGFAFLDGYAFIHDINGNIWGSDLNSVTAFGSSNYLNTNKSPDQGKGVYALRNYIVAFGKDSIELYVNQGNPAGSPLQRANITFSVGIASVQDTATVRQVVNAKIIGDSLYFVGRGREGVGIYKLNGESCQMIDGVNINSLIYQTRSNVGAVFIGGQLGAAFQLDTNNSLMYWEQSNSWTIWTNPTDGGSDMGFWTINAIEQGYANRLGGLAGKRFVSQNTTWTDDSVAFSMIAQTVKTDFGTEKLKTVNYVTLLGCDIQTGTATLEYSDDDYATWTTAGTFDLTKINPRIFRCGSFKGGRAWRVTHSDATDFRCESIKFQYKVGMH